jgi:GxxExxY protein
VNEESRKAGKGLELGALTERIIGAAITVHRTLGPGFLESIYEAALCVELRTQGTRFQSQVRVPVLYRGVRVGIHRLDLLVEGRVVVELKAVKAIENIHFSIVKSYLHAAGREHALLLNFHAAPLQIKRVRFP